MKINSLLTAGAIRHPDKDAIITADRTWTYRQLYDDAAKAAALLKPQGAGPGSTVAAMTFNEAEFVITAFATWMLGGIFVPVNHKFAVPEAEYLLSHCEATHGGVSPELHDTVTQAAPQVQWMTTDPQTGLLSQLAGYEPFVETHEADDDPALILYTSGTTSSPKGCVHTHDGISRLLPLIALALDYHRATRTLAVMPI